MQLKKILSIFCLAVSLTAAAQKTFTITGNINNLHKEKVFFRYYTGSKATYSDSVITENGKIIFHIPDSLRGLAAIRIHNRPDFIIRLIADAEDIVFNADAHASADSIEITGSEENKLYYRYRRHPNNPALQKDGSLPAVFAKLQMQVITPAGVANPRQWERDHFLDNIDLNNSAIIHSELFNPQINEYLRSIDDGSIDSYDVLIDSLCVALDKLLHRAGNETVYNFLVDDLSNYYRYGNLDFICAYLRQYYISRFTLVKNYPASEIHQRRSVIKHPTIGQTAPEIVMDKPGGGTTKMTDIKADHLLLVFWSTGCPHCKIAMPELKKIYDARKASFEILAIAQDTDRVVWQKYITDHGFTWINYTDPKGWEGKIPQDYDIQGTPTFILLDRDKTIISKPLELTDLKAELLSLKIL
jgi:thiol-disulfide isomerase/thioredoxin